MTPYQKGVELSQACKPDAALVAFETARAENPCDYRTHFGVGWALQKLERHEEAINAFTAAIELKNDVSGVLYSRALSNLILRRGDEALHDLDRALELSPDDIEAMYARGNSLKALERYDEAIAAYSKVIAANDRHFGAHDGRAKLRHRAGDFMGATADFTRCLELGHDTYDVRLLRGLAYQYSDQHTNAIDDLTIAISMEPDVGSTYLRRWSSYIKLGDHENAEKDFVVGTKLLHNKSPKQE
jgi:tetratricopeptide (TPR) repeat protein